MEPAWWLSENKKNHMQTYPIGIIAYDRKMIAYRPEWRPFTGSVKASILLQQIFFRWDKNDRKPFYKFKEPCGHHLYRTGDSWTEELGFTRTEFDTALKKITVSLISAVLLHTLLQTQTKNRLRNSRLILANALITAGPTDGSRRLPDLEQMTKHTGLKNFWNRAGNSPVII